MDRYIMADSPGEAAVILGGAAVATAGGFAVMAATAGAVSAAGTSAAAGAQTGVVTLFRAVSQAEFDDIAVHGFRAGRNSLAGKWFATTVDDAIAWGTALGGRFRVVQAEVSARTAEGMMHLRKLDGIGKAVYADVKQLTDAIIRIVR